jgi:hypothetical protein
MQALGIKPLTPYHHCGMSPARIRDPAARILALAAHTPPLHACMTSPRCAPRPSLSAAYCNLSPAVCWMNPRACMLALPCGYIAFISFPVKHVNNE